jgi:hypothetical protein
MRQVIADFGIGQCADRAVAIVIVVDLLGVGVEVRDVAARLADQLQPAHVNVALFAVPRTVSAERLVHRLRVARRVVLVHQVLGRDASHGLRHAVAVTVINDGHTSLLDQVILEVVRLPIQSPGR